MTTTNEDNDNARIGAALDRLDEILSRIADQHLSGAGPAQIIALPKREASRAADVGHPCRVLQLFPR